MIRRAPPTLPNVDKTQRWGDQQVAETKKQPEVDPRHRLAQKYLQNARDEMVAKDAEKPKRQRKRPPSKQGKPTLADLQPSISGSTYLHGMMLAFVMTAGLLSVALCYHFFIEIPMVGRVIAMPAGIMFFIAMSYASAFYLGIIETTSTGHTEPDSALEGDWRDWFWTMPATWAVLGATVMLGWVIGNAAPPHFWLILGCTVWLIYPVLQLSTLETGSPASPISLPVLRTLATRPLIWMTLYGVSFVLGLAVSWLWQVTWREPPFLTLLWMGPILTVALLIYAWLLGQVARWFTIGGG